MNDFAVVTYDQKIKWVRKFDKYASENECIEKWDIYQAYRSEGQSDLVSRQYAGLLVDADISED
jgi:hypothetical protein